MNEDKIPLIVLIGRTNVGKSTIFNRLVEKNQAIVSPIENTTRDFNVNITSWRGFDFRLVDTAGIMDVLSLKKKTKKDLSALEQVEQKTQQQAYDFIKKADLLFFVVDSKTGLLAEDKKIANFLKRRAYQDKTILLVNKVDDYKQSFAASEFNKLSFDKIINISATTGSGLGDLLDLSINFFKQSKKKFKKELKSKNLEKINLCIIGKPNVGKSSLLNALIGYEKAIVSEMPHTTREPQNTELIYKDKIINIIDTAGISRKGKKSKGLEKHGIVKSMQALNKADIVLLVIDINEPISKQDAKLVEEITDLGKSFIIIANKWDLLEERNTKKWTQEINASFPFIAWAPIIFVSALKKQKTDKIFDLVLRINEARQMEINETALSRFLEKMVKVHRPSKGKGVKHPRVYSLRQTWSKPPRFEIKIGAGEDLHNSYLRFLENRIRENFDFFGTPVKVSVKKKKKIHGRQA